MSDFETVQNVTDITDGSLSISWQTRLLYALAIASEIILIPAQLSIRWVGSAGKEFAACQLELAPTYGADPLLGRLSIW
jgi:hypothetical protein